MVLGWEVLVIHKLISPFRTSIDYQLSFRFTLLRNQIINTSESFFGNFLVKSRSLWVTMSIFDKQHLWRDLPTTGGGMDGWLGNVFLKKTPSPKFGLESQLGTSYFGVCQLSSVQKHFSICEWVFPSIFDKLQSRKPQVGTQVQISDLEFSLKTHFPTQPPGKYMWKCMWAM